MTATTSRLTLTIAAQDLTDGAVNEHGDFVQVYALQDLENSIPKARAIEAATTALLAAVRYAHKFGGMRPNARPYPEDWKLVVAAADALERLMGVPS